MEWVVGCMRLVTCYACASLGSVDMDIVKVLAAISETGQRRSLRGKNKCFFMTHKTERIVFDGKRCVKCRREIFSEHPEVV